MERITGSLRNTLGALLKLHQQGNLDRYLTAFRVFQSEENPRNMREYHEDLEQATEMGLLDRVTVDGHIDSPENIGYRPIQNKIYDIKLLLQQ